MKLEIDLNKDFYSALDKWKHIVDLMKFLDNQYSFENRIIVYDFKYSVGGRVEMRLFEEILLS